MLKKEIKTYKQGNREVQKININKADNIHGTVYILRPSEYKEMEEKIKKLEYEQKEHGQYKIAVERLEKTLEKINTENLNKIIEINKDHANELNELNEKNKKEFKKLIVTVNILKAALENIARLGFVDILRSKHKQIANDQVQKIDKKPVYELAPKK